MNNLKTIKKDLCKHDKEEIRDDKLLSFQHVAMCKANSRIRKKD